LKEKEKPVMQPAFLLGALQNQLASSSTKSASSDILL
jgi:hypothetical protein